MKKLLSVLAICFSISAFAQNMVTFQVDMAGYAGTFTDVNLNGNFNGWCGPCALMAETAPGSGVYAITVDLAAGDIEYKFTVDGWTDQENLTPGSGCTLTTGGFTNRLYNVAGTATIPTVCWESCAACGVSTNADLTVSVDMNEYADPYTTVHVSGSFNGWSGTANPLTETAPGSGVYATTISVPEGQHEYKFTIDDWAAQENLVPGTPCVLTTSGFTNRVVTVAGNTTQPTVCWQSCTECGIDNTSDVTFRVDMNQYTAPYSSVAVFGSFNGWCSGCDPMTDADADGIYEVTLTLTNADYEYKFIVDPTAATEAAEQFVAGEPCTVGVEFVNRFISVSEDASTPAFCWESCSACTGGGCQAPTGMDVVEIGFGGTNPRVNATWVNPEGTTSCEVKGGRISDASAGTANPVFQNAANTKILNQTNGSTVNFNIALYNNPTIPFVIGKTYGYEVRCACADGSGFSDWSGIIPEATFVVPALPVTGQNSTASTKLLDAGVNAMNIFPNPAEGSVNVQIELTESGSVEVFMTNALGQVVLQERMNGESIMSTMDVSTLESGIYMMAVRTASGMVTERVIIK